MDIYRALCLAQYYGILATNIKLVTAPQLILRYYSAGLNCNALPKAVASYGQN